MDFISLQWLCFFPSWRLLMIKWNISGGLYVLCYGERELEGKKPCVWLPGRAGPPQLRAVPICPQDAVPHECPDEKGSISERFLPGCLRTFWGLMSLLCLSGSLPALAAAALGAPLASHPASGIGWFLIFSVFVLLFPPPQLLKLFHVLFFCVLFCFLWFVKGGR